MSTPKAIILASVLLGVAYLYNEHQEREFIQNQYHQMLIARGSISSAPFSTSPLFVK